MELVCDDVRYVGRGFYVVRTQTGVERALEHHCGDAWGEVCGYPSTYPCIVTMVDSATTTELNALPLNRLRWVLEGDWLEEELCDG